MIEFYLHGTALTDRTMASLESIWEKSSLRVSALQFGSVSSTASLQRTVAFFRGMLLAPSLSSNPRSFDFGYLAGYGDFSAICSAIQVSPSLEKLECDLPDHFTARSQDIRRFWVWAVYALFSAEATRTIKHLQLGMEHLSANIVEVFTAVLEARDPLVYLRDGELRLPSIEAARRVPAVVEVVPNATLFSGSDLQELKTEDRTETLRVVEDPPEKLYVCVVYPGAGVCWVHRSQIKARREIELPSTLRTYESLSLGISMFTGLDDLTRLLQCIGSELSRLELIGEAGVVLDDDFFVHLFAACPKLRSMAIVNSEVATFDWLASVGSQLTTLSLRDTEPRQHQGYKRLLATLASATTHLVELHLQNRLPSHESLIASIMLALDLNPRIERLLLSIHDDVIDHPLQRVLAQRLSEADGKTLNIQKAPLALPSKLAFLSVLTSSRTYGGATNGDSNAATAQFDTAVIAIIFRFAAPCKHRVCRFIPPVEPLFFRVEDDE